MIIREARATDAESIARVNVDGWRTTYIGIVPQAFLDSLSYEMATTRWQARLSDPAELWPGWFCFVAERGVPSALRSRGRNAVKSRAFQARWEPIC